MVSIPQIPKMSFPGSDQNKSLGAENRIIVFSIRVYMTCGFSNRNARISDNPNKDKRHNC